MRSFRRQKISNSTMITPKDSSPKSTSAAHALENTASSGVSIHEPLDGSGSSCYSVQYSDDEISRSAMYMYDSATWRMYNRIMADRRRRAEIAERLNLASDLNKYDDQATSGARSKKNMPSPADQAPAATVCDNDDLKSSASQASSRRSSIVSTTSRSEPSSYREDEIFDLEM